MCTYKVYSVPESVLIQTHVCKHVLVCEVLHWYYKGERSPKYTLKRESIAYMLSNMHKNVKTVKQTVIKPYRKPLSFSRRRRI